MLSAYEHARLAQIAQNEAMLEQLGLSAKNCKLRDAPERKPRVPLIVEPREKSRRVRNVPASYAEGLSNRAMEEEEREADGEDTVPAGVRRSNRTPTPMAPFVQEGWVRRSVKRKADAAPESTTCDDPWDDYDSEGPPSAPLCDSILIVNDNAKAIERCPPMPPSTKWTGKCERCQHWFSIRAKSNTLHKHDCRLYVPPDLPPLM